MKVFDKEANAQFIDKLKHKDILKLWAMIIVLLGCLSPVAFFTDGLFTYFIILFGLIGFCLSKIIMDAEQKNKFYH